MNTGRFVLSQIIDLVHRQFLNRLVKRHGADYCVRHPGCRQRFICMALARLTGRKARGKLPDEFVEITGWERKHANKVLKTCWLAMEQPCGNDPSRSGTFRCARFMRQQATGPCRAAAAAWHRHYRTVAVMRLRKRTRPPTNSGGRHSGGSGFRDRPQAGRFADFALAGRSGNLIGCGPWKRNPTASDAWQEVVLRLRAGVHRFSGMTKPFRKEMNPVKGMDQSGWLRLMLGGISPGGMIRGLVHNHPRDHAPIVRP